MIRKTRDGVEWLEFELFAEEKRLEHGVFLRHGGVSSGPLASLNVGGRSGDNSESILENRQRILRALDIRHVAEGNQVHGKEVVYLREQDQRIGDCDALITDKLHLGLMVKHADCQPAIFYDPIRHALATVHSGWRGNVKNVYSATVQKMIAVFGSKPQDLLVGIGPSLGPNHSEFKNYRTEFPETFWEFQIRPEYFDLWAIARHQLHESGILPHHIQIASICTFANPQDYFSYRRDKTKGNNATVAILKP